MAGADYYRCDKCGAKTFYDTNLDWQEDPKTFELYLPRVGSMKVICLDCSKEYEVQVVKRAT